MALGVYADRPGRAAAQLLGDLLALAAVWVTVRVALWVRARVSELAVPGRQLEGAGGALSEDLTAAGEAAGRVPVVGEELRGPIDAAGGAAQGVADAGRSFQDAVADIALLAAILVAVVPLLLVLGWVLARVRWVRRATAGRWLARHGGDDSLFALRALAGQPLARLAMVSHEAGGADLATAWRAGDPIVLARLAELERAALGLRRARPG